VVVLAAAILLGILVIDVAWELFKMFWQNPNDTSNERVLQEIRRNHRDDTRR